MDEGTPSLQGHRGVETEQQDTQKCPVASLATTTCPPPQPSTLVPTRPPLHKEEDVRRPSNDKLPVSRQILQAVDRSSGGEYGRRAALGRFPNVSNSETRGGSENVNSRDIMHEERYPSAAEDHTHEHIWATCTPEDVMDLDEQIHAPEDPENRSVLSWVRAAVRQNADNPSSEYLRKRKLDLPSSPGAPEEKRQREDGDVAMRAFSASVERYFRAMNNDYAPRHHSEAAVPQKIVVEGDNDDVDTVMGDTCHPSYPSSVDEDPDPDYWLRRAKRELKERLKLFPYRPAVRSPLNPTRHVVLFSRTAVWCANMRAFEDKGGVRSSSYRRPAILPRRLS
ncbi:hypothetical protein NM688_g7527 [Phlebia brevispora]|uniref:Uncharacterized protein n=1 Tax=Phlebia brevispora TaxID=194682 RepID=A0ACC1S489_9APHY|nr:hypothetical protein NM688_g7527 [Phlebia brevispora]